MAEKLIADIGAYHLELELFEHIPHSAFSRYFEATRKEIDGEPEEQLARATLELFASAKATKNGKSVDLGKTMPGVLVIPIINLAEPQRQEVLDLGNFLNSLKVTSGEE